MINIVYVFATSESSMRAILDSFQGRAHMGYTTCEEIRCPDRKHAKRVAFDSDAAASQLGWDHAGTNRTLQPDSPALRGEEFDPGAQDTRSEANKRYVERLLHHIRGSERCWRVDCVPMGDIDALGSAWRDERIAAAG
jgi:hypothetical protein